MEIVSRVDASQSNLRGQDSEILTFWPVLLKQAQAKRTSWLCGRDEVSAERFLGVTFGVATFSGDSVFGVVGFSGDILSVLTSS